MAAKLKTGKNFELFLFESLTEMKNFSEKKSYDLMAGYTDINWIGLGKEFSKMPSWEDLKAFETKGWDYGKAVMESFVTRLSSVKIPELKSRKRTTKFSTEGDDIDPDRFYQGDTNFHRETKREEKTGVTEVTIFIDTSTSNNVDSEDILWRGAAGLALAKILEDKGYQVEIWNINGSHLYSDDLFTGVYNTTCLKRCQDPFDVTTLINAISGWFYRACTLPMFYTICDKRGQKPAYGLGRPASITPALLDEIVTDVNRIQISGVFSFSAAVSLVEAEINRIAAPK